MHRNIDLIDTNMGVQLFHPRMEQAEVGGTSMAKSINMTTRDPSGKMKYTKCSSLGVSTRAGFEAPVFILLLFLF